MNEQSNLDLVSQAQRELDLLMTGFMRRPQLIGHNERRAIETAAAAIIVLQQRALAAMT